MKKTRKPVAIVGINSKINSAIVRPRKSEPKPVTEKDVVAYVLQQTAVIMLAASPVKDAFQQAAEKHRADLFTRMTPEERDPIITMRNVIVELCRKLASCKSQEALNQTYAYLKALNDGEVMVAVASDEGTIVQYEKNI